MEENSIQSQKHHFFFGGGYGGWECIDIFFTSDPATLIKNNNLLHIIVFFWICWILILKLLQPLQRPHQIENVCFVFFLVLIIIFKNLPKFQRKFWNFPPSAAPKILILDSVDSEKKRLCNTATSWLKRVSFEEDRYGYSGFSRTLASLDISPVLQ